MQQIFLFRSEVLFDLLDVIDECLIISIHDNLIVAPSAVSSVLILFRKIVIGSRQFPQFQPGLYVGAFGIVVEMVAIALQQFRCHLLNEQHVLVVRRFQPGFGDVQDIPVEFFKMFGFPSLETFRLYQLRSRLNLSSSK